MLCLKDVNLSFGEKQVLTNFSYSFEDNKIYVITGPSGCGKSTLLRLACGLLSPTSGSITYGDGTIVNKADKEIFMMHQHYTNFPWKSVIDNVLFPIRLHTIVTEVHKQEAIAMLSKVGLEQSADLYPHELSGGMKQRVALARTLMMKPNMLLMDEPLSALDPKMRLQMQNLIIDLHKETSNTIIMVTHDEDEAIKLANIRIKF
jgi:ABC-type nitrate/sulfonate/bicarbonate transport system ATPase subunit